MPLRAWIEGRRAERRAARCLRRHGMRIVARNVRAGQDEIDLLARDGEIVVVVEVRSRAQGIAAADFSIDHAKERRLQRAWADLRRRYRIPPSTPVRFDLVLLAGHDVEHVPGALSVRPAGTALL